MPPTNTVKIAISLPEALLKDVEQARQASAESRSAFFRRAVETLLREARHRDRVCEYVQGYVRMPESPEEVREADAAADEVLRDQEWE